MHLVQHQAPDFISPGHSGDGQGYQHHLDAVANGICSSAELQVLLPGELAGHVVRALQATVGSVLLEVCLVAWILARVQDSCTNLQAADLHILHQGGVQVHGCIGLQAFALAISALAGGQLQSAQQSALLTQTANVQQACKKGE